MLRRKTGLILAFICFSLVVFARNFGWNFPTFYGNSKFQQVRLCDCDRIYVKPANFDASDVKINWCSEESSLRGPRQKVVSYSLYGNLSDTLIRERYLSLINDTARRVRESYPGWLMRIYHNFTESLVPATLCDIYCKNPQVDFCSVHDIHEEISQNSSVTLKESLNYFRQVHPMVWRFYPSFDSLVDAFVSRDLDSEILDREISAVSQWLNSNFTFHIMRDHPNHHLPMMGGMWGVKTVQSRELLPKAMLRLVRFAQKQQNGVDQDALEEFVWSIAKHDVMAHDSYNCRLRKLLKKSALKTFPFPERRPPSNDFIGNVITDKERLIRDMKPCPQACRPQNHTNWIFC